MQILSTMEISGDTVTWTQKDASDELTVVTPIQTSEDEVSMVDKVYGLRTLECALKIRPMEESTRTQWVSYRLMTTLADEEEGPFEDWDW